MNQKLKTKNSKLKTLKTKHCGHCRRHTGAEIDPTLCAFCIRCHFDEPGKFTTHNTSPFTLHHSHFTIPGVSQ